MAINLSISKVLFHEKPTIEQCFFKQIYIGNNYLLKVFFLIFDKLYKQFYENATQFLPVMTQQSRHIFHA